MPFFLDLHETLFQLSMCMAFALYVNFIDYEKAFDSEDQEPLAISIRSARKDPQHHQEVL
ncbi:hypothetical protein DPMN_000443 [Dreissena polymorpha]|uniref:Uncharacterized protein n=1 Tax=Dreissena polymorpha TaxID=45954 RepID=A0A9D4MJL2_DREPO|nr:hypothetical protein DPMN_000443 [Dreissena polymorpha]